MKQYKKYVIPYKSAFILGPIFMIVEVLGRNYSAEINVYDY